MDPQTRLLTSDSPQELVSSGVFTADTVKAAGAGIVASEYLGRDLNTFGALARRRVPVGTLSHASGGRPERSVRYREVLAPAGIPYELRAAFVSRDRSWGAAHIARHEGQPDFSAQDVTALASITGLVAEGIRSSLRFDAGGRSAGGPASPGLVVLGERNEVELITLPARELLESMRPDAGSGTDETPPGAVLALAAFTRGATDSGAAARAVAVPTSSGWMTLHASLPDGAGTGRVAIVLERSASPESTAVRLEAHGVTAREREIAGLLAAGLTNPEVAERLVLSPYTVQDHMKSLFEKTNVSSRQELVARIFLDDYLPRIDAGRSLDGAGRLRRGLIADGSDRVPSTPRPSWPSTRGESQGLTARAASASAAGGAAAPTGGRPRVGSHATRPPSPGIHTAIA
jgi:DNA-binding CsgD family transcriptional regulator